MNRKDAIKLLLVSGVSIFLGALTILVVYFVSTRKAPSAPESKPKAEGGMCYVQLFFPSPTPSPTITPTSTPGPSATPTLTPTVTLTATPGPSSTPTLTPTLTPTSTPQPGCYSTCTSDSNCSNSLICQSVSGVNRCVNSSCPYNSDCVCGQSPTSTPTPTPAPQTYVPQATPTEIVLPQAGVTTSSWTAITGGAVLVLLGILFFAL